MKIIFLDTKTMGDIPNLKTVEDFGSLTLYEQSLPEQVTERIKGHDIVITNKVKLDKKIIAASPDLKLICIAATGTNNVDLDFAREKGIPVKNARDYSTHSVAEVTFTLILSLLTQIHYYDEFVKSGKYSRHDIFTHIGRPFWQLFGKQLGIIGLGNIGSHTARIAEGFGMKVTYYSSSGKKRHPSYPLMELDELLRTSDIVSIHSPLNEKTRNLLGYEQLQKMKPTALLINTGRGGIVKEKDLVKALNENLIRGAALDVFEQEPMSPDNPLLEVRDKDKMILTPHIAWASLEARTHLMEIVYQNIKSFVEENKKSV